MWDDNWWRGVGREQDAQWEWENTLPFGSVSIHILKCRINQRISEVLFHVGVSSDAVLTFPFSKWLQISDKNIFSIPTPTLTVLFVVFQFWNYSSRSIFSSFKVNVSSHLWPKRMKNTCWFCYLCKERHNNEPQSPRSVGSCSSHSQCLSLWCSCLCDPIMVRIHPWGLTIYSIRWISPSICRCSAYTPSSAVHLLFA